MYLNSLVIQQVTSLLFVENNKEGAQKKRLCIVKALDCI